MTRLQGAIACCESTASNRYGERDDDQNRRDCERDPHTGGNSLGTRRCDVDRRRCEREHSAHNGCTGDEAEIARQVEHAGNDAPPVRADIRHDGGVVGRLEQRIAGGDDDDGGDVARDAERRRQHG
jgi:hypothetical protein